MNRTFQILILLFLVSCGQNERPTSFYENCNESQVNLNNGIVVTDSLGYFSYQIPDSSWVPLKFLNEKENGVVVGDTSLGYFRFFSVNQSNYTYHWNWEEEQKNIEKEFNVLETGDIFLRGMERPYHLILFEDDSPPMISLYVTVLDTIRKRQYTLNLAIEYAEDYKARICNLKPLMESFKTMQ